MGTVQFRNKTSEKLACFIGHNGWRVVKPDEVIEVPDDDVVTPALTEWVDGEEKVKLGDDGKPVQPATSSADSYRAATDQWAEVGVPAPPAPAPPAPPAPTEAAPAAAPSTEA